MRPYLRPLPFAWWLTRRPYTLFVVRELTAVFVGGYALVLLLLLRSLARGPEAYAAYLDGLRSPLMITFHVVALAAALYHTVTWFTLAPMALPLRLRGRRVPGRTIVAVNLAAWVLLSALVAAFVLWR